MLIFEMFSHGRNRQANSILNQERVSPPGVSPTITHAPLDVAAPRLPAPDADTPPTAPLAATAACVRLRGEEVVPSCHAPVIICVQTAPGLVTAK